MAAKKSKAKEQPKAQSQPTATMPSSPSGVVPQEYEMVPIDAIQPHPRNVNEGDVGAIVTSIKANQFYGACEVQRSSSMILAGKHRWLAAKECGLKLIPVIWLDVNDDEALRIILVDNRTTRLGNDDPNALADLLQEILANQGTLTGTGFDTDALDDLLAELGRDQNAGITDEDSVPEVPETPVTMAGDLWRLGDHKLLCGDSTKPEDVARLMDGEKADLVLSDPPYGLNIVKVKDASAKGVVVGAKPYGSSQSGVVGGGGSSGAMYPFGGVKQAAKRGVVGGENIVRPKLYAPIINDDSTDSAQAFYGLCLTVGIKDFILFGGNYFTEFLPPSPCWVIWDKQNSGNFADVEMAWTSFDKGAKLYAFMWNGLSREGDRKTELETRVHPSQKPVGLFVKIFADFPGDVVLDGFLGSGSTLIACEKTGRKCYGLELSPDYCDVIVSRFEAFSGKSATLDSTGQTFAEVKASRLGVTKAEVNSDCASVAA